MPMMFGALGGSWLFGGQEVFAKRFFDRLVEGETEEMDRMNEESRRERLWDEDISKEFERLAYERRRMDEEEAAEQDQELSVRDEARREQLFKRSIELAHRVLGYIPWVLVGEHMLPLLTKEQRAVVETRFMQSAAEAETEAQPEPAAVAVPVSPAPQPQPVKTEEPATKAEATPAPTPAGTVGAEAVPQEPKPRAPVEGDGLAKPEPEME